MINYQIEISPKESPQLSRNTSNDIYLVSSILIIIMAIIVLFGGTLKDT